MNDDLSRGGSAPTAVFLVNVRLVERLIYKKK